MVTLEIYFGQIRHFVPQDSGRIGRYRLSPSVAASTTGHQSDHPGPASHHDQIAHSGDS